MSIDKSALGHDLKITPHQITEDCARQPGLFAYYAEKAREANARLKHLKLQLDVYEAALDKQIRDNFLARGQKFTERQIEVQIKLNPEWQERKKATHAAESEVEQMDAIMTALRQKKDMLVVVAHNVRSEMFAAPRMDDQQTAIPLVPAG